MLEVIEKLLILQECDHKILRLKTELANIGPERQMLQSKTAGSQAALDAAKLHGKQIETDRKKLELEVEAKKQQIEKYALQQFQTKRNEEYRALAHEIEICKADIVKLEDQQLELMEQAEKTQKDVAAAAQAAGELKKVAEKQIADLGGREENLKQELSELEGNREQLASVVDEGVQLRYERLFRNKEQKVVVGIDSGVCGGCHMKLPVQILVSCKGQHEIVSCPNCSRLLYYTRDMSLLAAD